MQLLICKDPDRYLFADHSLMTVFFCKEKYNVIYEKVLVNRSPDKRFKRGLAGAPPLANVVMNKANGGVYVGIFGELYHLATFDVRTNLQH